MSKPNCATRARVLWAGRPRWAGAKHTHGSAWEVWEHVLIGGMHAVAPYKFDYCQGFEPQSKCRHSPCRPGAAWMGRTKDEYYLSWTANTATTCCELADAAVPCCKDRMQA